jgi:hypothetical protein
MCQRVLHAVGVGAVGGILAMVLIVRLNPTTAPDAVHAVPAAVVWALWGTFFFGLQALAVLGLATVIARQAVPRPGSPIVLELVAAMYLVAAIFSRLNADLSERFLTGSAHRLLGQDAVTWLAVAILLALAGPYVRRRRARRRWLATVLGVAVLLPTVRLQSQPSPSTTAEQSTRRPLGTPRRSLLVIGVDGIDLNLLMANATRLRLQRLEALRETSSWGLTSPEPPFLYRSLWTTTATGSSPSTHGVKGHTGWRLRPQSDEPILLLPWTPVGSKAMLPWGLAQPVPPPASRVPPMWSRLEPDAVTVQSVSWPGLWEQDDGPSDPAPQPPSKVERDFRTSLDMALEPFPEHREAIWTAVLEDLARVETALAGARRPTPSVIWVQQHAMAEVRRRLEPTRPEEVRRQAVLDLALELLDTTIGRLIDAMPADCVVALIAPYGYDRPDGWERLRRLAGFAATWNASAASCPAGLVYLHGAGVRSGRRHAPCELSDLVPTLCYLLGLPLAHSMDGRVILEAVDPAYLQQTPLWVVD